MKVKVEFPAYILETPVLCKARWDERTETLDMWFYDENEQEILIFPSHEDYESIEIQARELIDQEINNPELNFG